jgi:FkbM family methyltransferase
MYSTIKKIVSKYCSLYLINRGRFSLIFESLIKCVFVRKRCLITDQDIVGFLYFNSSKSRFFLRHSSYIESKILTDGIHARHVLKEILYNLSPNSIFIDVGANIGSISIPIAVCAEKIGVEVVSCEASSVIRKRLEANIGLNQLSNIRVNDAAIFSHNRGIKFYEQTLSNDNMGLSSVKQNDDIGDFIETSMKSMTLDDLYCELKSSKQISVIKIDVQGAEIDVLYGASAAIKSQRPVIVFEHEDEYHLDPQGVKQQIIVFFALHNYSLYAMDSNLPGVLIPIDLSVYVNTNIVALPNLCVE